MRLSQTIFSLAILVIYNPVFSFSADKPPARRAEEVLVVFNEESRISKRVAADYVEKRKGARLLALHCPDAATNSNDETVSLEFYRKEIETPVRTYLAAHPGIEFIVLTKGMPLRIEGAETGERPIDSTPVTPLRTSVDSHLAALDYPDIRHAKTLKITGSGATGLGRINRYWNSREPFSHAKFGGYLVTRLDGYTEADAKALVARALQAEQKTPDGTYLFDVQPIFGLGEKGQVPTPLPESEIKDEAPWYEYNADMQKAHELLQSRGISSEIDLTEKFVGHRSGLMGYFSWGSNDAKFSASAYASLKFAPGSICDTAVSTSGRTFLPTEGGQSLMADLLAHGLTCAKGYTDEPLLQANASPSILLEHYTSGYSMAESFYAASHFVGWQDVIIGDPLCAPYR